MSITGRRVLLTVIVSALSAIQAFTSQPPRLIIFISVDQMREDYFERFAPYFTGGLRQLYTEGVFFSNASLNYASSVTCLGHATLSTGTYPMTSGIIDNEWLNPITRKSVYCVEDTLAGKVDGEGGGESPHNLLVTGIGDWLKTSSPKSKVITASGKDRAAILMGGKHPDCAYWYSRKNGHMVTSDYYTQHVPTWVTEFNHSQWIEKNVPPAWTKLLPESVYTKEGPDEFIAEATFNSSSSFPHQFEPGKKSEQLLSTPYGDLLMLDFAREAIRSEQLGQRGVADLLCLSLSDCDYIGHAFGSNSHEMIDHLVRLDRALGSFFDDAQKVVGVSSVLVVLSADHGVMPLPEFLTQFRHEHARRIIYQTEIKKQRDSLDQLLQKEWNIHEQIFENGGFLNYAAAARVGKDSLQVEGRAGQILRSIEGIADVYFRRELMDARIPDRPYLSQFRRSYYPPRGEDYQIRFCEDCLVSSHTTGTSHGSVYSYDTHVPIAFWGAGAKKAIVSREVHTVDIAPTLGRILNIEYPRTVDGVPLEELN
jgi:predicted AlkP superfamily pyrophosphatase or phosphodiesterase